MYERGAEVALFDYAFGNQSILNNTSFIAIPEGKISDVDMYNKFKQNFPVYLYNSVDDLQKYIESNKIDLIYKITDGSTVETLLHNTVPHFIHCVFSTKVKQGAFYCPISPF